ncbi:tRNA 2-thiouridine(34) synthase MnmA [Spiroplasma corruscae]|uniref:tRNA 2-thiouridine(34) synthase MnmA n=1 Tax=Spiroplasma corruscae TaxID=216934 RepID=UPI000B8C13B5
MKKKVIVGLSGGVDSSVAAKLLIDQGYEVEGLFMRNWDSNINNDVLGNNHSSQICPQEVDYNDAKLVAEKLKIKIHRIDFIKEYWDKVFEYFIFEYKKGRTPNPDILCNKFIKFDLFLRHAIDILGADYIAMGHYAGVVYNDINKEYNLIKAKDLNKDQSYFLSELNQYQLSKTLFPLYEYKKPDVRKIASKLELVVANKKDSTGICFIGERNFTKFLQNYIPNQPGKIIDIETNRVLGEHIGVMYYTIGQRKGLNLGGNKEPYYVAKKDIDNKILYVSCLSEEKYLYSNGCTIKDFNWIINKENVLINNRFECNSKFRYRQEDVLVDVTLLKNNDLSVVFTKPLRAITEGQQAVLYIDNICLGGGIIDSVF